MAEGYGGEVCDVYSALQTQKFFLVHASSQTGPERLLVLPSSHPGVQVQQLRSVDPCQSVGDVAFDCQISDEQMLDSDNEALAANLRAWNRFGAAEYLAGITERVLTFAVDYAREREQFGRKIGSFQAVQHMLADIAVATRSLVNLMDLSSTEMSDVDDAERVMISVTAKARAGGAQSVSACETVLQVLGGIGYTVEHSLNHFFKRALSLAAQQGPPPQTCTCWPGGYFLPGPRIAEYWPHIGGRAADPCP